MPVDTQNAVTPIGPEGFGRFFLSGSHRCPIFAQILNRGLFLTERGKCATLCAAGERSQAKVVLSTTEV